MPDFASAFNEGLQAAETADRARREIADVFSELSRQMDAATRGTIAIARGECEIPVTTARLLTNPWEPRKTYWAILAWNPMVAKCPKKEIARWSQDAAGYPCKITCRKWERTCEDREALENSLAELLRDPVVGEKLYALTRLEPSSEATGQEEEHG